MKQDIAEYLIDSFVDFKGETRKVVICALSQTPVETDGDNLMVVWSNGEDVDPNADIYHNVMRTLALGVAICCPMDVKVFSEEVGKKIAFNRAEQAVPKLVALEPGVINTTLVKGFLQQEMDFIKRCPEKFIKGYEEAKKNHDQKLEIEETIAKLDDQEWQVINAAIEGVNIAKCTKLAKYFIDNEITELAEPF